MKKFKYIAIFIACSSIVNVWALNHIECSNYDKPVYRTHECCKNKNTNELWWVKNVYPSLPCKNDYIDDNRCTAEETKLFEEPSSTFADKCKAAGGNNYN